MAAPKPPTTLRRPPAAQPSAAAVDRFLLGGAEPLQAIPGAQERPQAPAQPGLIERRGGTRRKASVYFDPDVSAALSAWAKAQGREVSHVVNEAVRQYLARKR